MKHTSVEKTLPGLMNVKAHAATVSFQNLSRFQTKVLAALTDRQSDWRITGAIAPSSKSLSSALARWHGAQTRFLSWARAPVL
jgi:hypothetical protein